MPSSRFTNARKSQDSSVNNQNWMQGETANDPLRLLLQTAQTLSYDTQQLSKPKVASNRYGSSYYAGKSATVSSSAKMHQKRASQQITQPKPIQHQKQLLSPTSRGNTFRATGNQSSLAMNTSSVYNTKKSLAGNEQTSMTALNRPGTTHSSYYNQTLNAQVLNLEQTIQKRKNKSKQQASSGVPAHQEYKITAQKLADKRMRTSQIVSKKNSQCLSINSYEDSGNDLSQNPFAMSTYQQNTDEIIITTVDRKKTFLASPTAENAKKAKPIDLNVVHEKPGLMSPTNHTVSTSRVTSKPRPVLQPTSALFKKTSAVAAHQKSTSRQGITTSHKLAQESYFSSTIKSPIGSKQPPTYGIASPKNVAGFKTSAVGRATPSAEILAQFSNQYSISNELMRPSPYYKQQSPLKKSKPYK